MTLDEASKASPWPLPPGRYVVHWLLPDDQYSITESTEFTVEK